MKTCIFTSALFHFKLNTNSNPATVFPHFYWSILRPVQASPGPVLGQSRTSPDQSRPVQTGPGPVCVLVVFPGDVSSHLLSIIIAVNINIRSLKKATRTVHGHGENATKTLRCETLPSLRRQGGDHVTLADPDSSSSCFDKSNYE